MKRNYEELLDCTPPVSTKTPMSLVERAAQFAPFAALTGYEAVIEKTVERAEAKSNRTTEELYDI